LNELTERGPLPLHVGRLQRLSALDGDFEKRQPAEVRLRGVVGDGDPGRLIRQQVNFRPVRKNVIRRLPDRRARRPEQDRVKRKQRAKKRSPTSGATGILDD
jgi:hypothetical protein